MLLLCSTIPTPSMAPISSQSKLLILDEDEEKLPVFLGSALLNFLPPQPLTCISCSKLSSAPPPWLFLSPGIYWTPSPSPGCPFPIQIQLFFLIISLMKPSLIIIRIIRSTIPFNVWTMHPATQSHILLSSNRFMYVYLVSSLYFDLQESRACLLPLCSLQKQWS